MNSPARDPLGLWHGPAFLYRSQYLGMGLVGISLFSLSLLSGAIMLTWVYNSSGGSILIAALFHASVSVVFTSKVAQGPVVNIMGALYMIGSLAVVLIAGPKDLSRSKRQVIAG